MQLGMIHTRRCQLFPLQRHHRGRSLLFRRLCAELPINRSLGGVEGQPEGGGLFGVSRDNRGRHQIVKVGRAHKGKTTAQQILRGCRTRINQKLRQRQKALLRLFKATNAHGEPFALRHRQTAKGFGRHTLRHAQRLHRATHHRRRIPRHRQPLIGAITQRSQKDKLRLITLANARQFREQINRLCGDTIDTRRRNRHTVRRQRHLFAPRRLHRSIRKGILTRPLRGTKATR